MSSINSASTGMVRIDSSRNAEYLYQKPKTSFWQKAGRFFSGALKIAAPILSVAIPGVGLAAGAGMYGLANITDHFNNKAALNDASEMAQWQASKKNMRVVLPGLFEQASQADIQTDFITPQSMVDRAAITIVDRELTQHSAVENFNFY